MNLPNFLIVGAAKSGTTSLHNYLNQHPEVFMPAIKETYFLSGLKRDAFPEFFASPIIENFPEYAQLYEEATSSKAIGEACVAYLFYFERTIPQIKEYLDNPMIFVILRNPIDRAFSHFTELRMNGLEDLSFEKAIEQEAERTAAGRWWWKSQYISIGCYADQIEAYINAFGREKVSIFLFEDFAQNPQIITKSIFGKLEVDDSFLPDVGIRYKSTGVPKNRFWSKFLVQDNQFRKLYRKMLPLNWRTRVAGTGWKAQLQDQILEKPELSPVTRQQLLAYYEPDVVKLRKLTGISFNDWW